MDEEKSIKPDEEQGEIQDPVLEEPTIEPEQPPAELQNEEAAESELPEDEDVPIVRLNEPAVIYRWDFEDEKKKKNKGKGKGAFAFAAIVSCAFLIVIGLLIGVLAFRDSFKPKQTETDTVALAQNLLPATVLISASNGTSGSTGSGFFIRENGLIATNYHVVENMSNIKVKRYQSTQLLDATLVGYNSECDLAVLKVEGDHFPTVVFANSDEVQVGEVAVAIGNPSGEDGEWTVTKGIVSSVSRKMLIEESTEFLEYNIIQTDAAVNPGNSGGLLCNDRGEVIGVVSRKPIYREAESVTHLDSVTVFYEGIGYAIPGNGAKAILEGLIGMKSVDPVEQGLLRRRPKIGISISPIKKGEKINEDPETYAPVDGLLIVGVNSANNLLEEGDIIVRFDGKAVTDSREMIEMLYSYKRGQKVKLVVYKNGETTPTEIEIILGA